MQPLEMVKNGQTLHSKFNMADFLWGLGDGSMRFLLKSRGDTYAECLPISIGPLLTDIVGARAPIKLFFNFHTPLTMKT